MRDPVVGDKLHFWNPVISGNNADGIVINENQPFTAEVVYVHGPIMVNLRVTDHVGNAISKSSVPVREPRAYDAHGKDYVATWPQTSMEIPEAERHYP